MIISDRDFGSFVKSASLGIMIIGIGIFVLMSFTMAPFFETPAAAIIHISDGSVNPSQQENVLPKVVIITPEVKVKWINDDSVPYAIVSDVPYSKFWSGSFGSPLLMPGESYEYVFREVGTVNYHMMPGPWITGTIHIVP